MPDEALRSYRELNAWVAAYGLAKAVFEVSDGLQEASLRGAMRETSLSVASHIADAVGRPFGAECLQQLGVARGCLYKLETQVLLAADLGLVQGTTILMKTAETSRPLSKLMRSLKRYARGASPQAQQGGYEGSAFSIDDEHYIPKPPTQPVIKPPPAVSP